jgi:O-acetyl-ADP-ribose deacetylase (regulator of RNase III)
MPLDLAALERCLHQLADTASERRASVHMPRIGTGLGGGHWHEIEPLIRNTLLAASVPTTVYDLPSASCG